MKNNLLEVIVGAIVLIVSIGFIIFAYSTRLGIPSTGYEVVAKFGRIDGLRQGSDVRLSGVKVGTIKAIHLDKNTYLAVVHIHLPTDLHLPKDTAAEIASESLLGGKFLALTPGGGEETIPEGGEIVHTQSAVSLEALIGQFIFSAQGKD